MRRVMMLLAAMAVIVTLFAAVAYAATIEGTSQGERHFESNLNDTIFGRGGADFSDATPFTNDTDRANGNAGNDEISVADGDDRYTANGGNGGDVCFGDPGDEFMNCEDENVATPNGV